jgi:putative ABC transport system permease protein
MEGVEAVEILLDPVFAVNSSNMLVTVDGTPLRVEVNAVSTGFPGAVGMTLLQGRWFGPEDEGPQGAGPRVVPVLVNQSYVDAMDGDVIGTLIDAGGAQQRIVGVFDEFREHGEFVASRPMVLQNLRPDAEFGNLPLLVVVQRPGAAPRFEERLMDVLQRAAPGWDFDADLWTALQRAHHRTFLIPLMIAGGLVLFLLSLVGFGLLGVLWQNVIRRTPEMGLRRAMGATAGMVRLQVVLEMLTIALFALVLGLALIVQLPLSGILQRLDWELFVPAAVLSTVVLLVLCILFALYPSYQATRRDPVDALRCE